MKIEIAFLNNENQKLKNEIANLQIVIQRVKILESNCKKLEIDIDAEGKQWEIQKQAFIEILHAEIEGAKYK